MSTKIRSRVGDMRHRVTLQSRTLSRDDRGGATPTYADLATVWAAVEPVAGKEAWQAQQAQSNVTHVVTIRAYAGLTPRHRVKFGSRLLNIDSIANLEERGRYMELQCVEEV